MNAIQGFLSLLGRVLLASIFLIAIRNHFLQFEGINQAIKSRQIPAPTVVHVLAIGCMALGGISLVLGYKARIGALLLLIFLGLAGYFFHNFWHLASSIEREDALAQFLKNIALMGAMLFIIANGPGAWSLDRCWSKRDIDTP